MTLRAKLLLTVLGLVAIALVVSDLTSTTTLRSYLLKQTDQQLGASRTPFARRVGGLTTTTTLNTHSVTTQQPPPTQTDSGRPQFISDFFLQVRSPDGAIENQFTPNVLEDKDPLPNLPQSLVIAHEGKGPFTVGAVTDSSFTYRVSVSRSPNGEIFISAVALRSVDNTIHRLRNIELSVSLIILITLGIAAWCVVRMELRQLDRISLTAGAIAAGDLSQRVDYSNSKTEVGRLSEALNSMLARIETSFKETQASEERLRRFAADASHELRTPLTAIRGYAELFRQGAIRDEEHLARVLQRIESEAARMGLMVEDLLLLARLDQGRPLEVEPVNLCKVVADVIHDSRVVASERSIELDVEADEIVVMGDSARIHQVFSNLVGNALAHTPPHTQVNVDVTIVDEYAVINVKDNGPGLPADDTTRVFERFYRVDSGRSRHVGGTGLGLAIVKSIVDAHRGQVMVTSIPGEGACFTVKLPIVSPFTAIPQS